ncbi:protealysin inhibitor emfourin [Streptomyces sp. WM6368]|uniref:protealysin inhibitor emfourin n=1 Tax=Streptomyces sp. WM6368 TaxID=1415554 RepID=UPI0006AE5099|nr:protealysin inhibitor emfourin [Streptomyces sp. WM6368]KOU24475.1 metalloprotease [Streptomyces sp. WM6368]
MRIQVVRTGGFAGIERRAEVDTAGRPDEGEWRALAQLALRPGPPGHPADRVRDGFSYRITVDGRTVACEEPNLSEAQRTLISRVLKEGA